VLESAMLEPLRNAIDGIPGVVVAFLAAPAIWANMVWASPFTKTYRHRLSGLLSLMTGVLMVASLRGGDTPNSPTLLIGAGITFAAMFLTLVWPPTRDTRKRKVR
jgi:hypothetical protein